MNQTFTKNSTCSLPRCSPRCARDIVSLVQPTSEAASSPCLIFIVVAGNAVVRDIATHAALSEASGRSTVARTSNPVTLVNGVAAFAAYTNNSAGTDTLQAADGALVKVSGSLTLA